MRLWIEPFRRSFGSRGVSWVGIAEPITSTHIANTSAKLESAGVSATLEATNQTVYDAAGNLVTSIDPNGQSWSYTYDNRNRRITASDPLGRTTTWTNDVAGRVAAQVAPDNTATFYGYDLMDRRIAETNGMNQITLYGFDVSGNLTSLTDANNNVTQWSYDLLNRQISKIYADSTHDDYGYDALGNLKTQTNAAGQVATHSYDKQNRLTNSVWSSGSAPTVIRSYDALGRLIKLNNGNVTLGYAYDAANQLLAETNVISGNTFITGYGYDLDGRKQTLIYPSGNMVTNTFTARGQLQEIYANTPPPLATFAYDLDGRRTSRALANGVTTVYDYDMAGQLTNLAHTTISGTVASFAYDYNAVSSRTSTRREDSRNEVYGYDAIQQVTSVDYGDSTSEGFNYDPLGNLNTRTNVSGSVDTFTANNLNQYTAINATAPGYDSKGNLLTWAGGTNAYDAQNRLLTVQRDTNSAAFVYDGRNRCMQRTINGVTTTCIYDGWDLIAEYNGSTPLAEYVHGPGVDEVLARFTATNAVYYAGDALNSTAALTDGSGAVVERYRYTAFGQPTVFDASGNALAASAYGNHFTFQGREWFYELNLTDHRNRYYAPELQRWLNRDPLGDQGFIALRAGSLKMTYVPIAERADGPNLFTFVTNRPLDSVDPYGTISVPGIPVPCPLTWVALYCIPECKARHAVPAPKCTITKLGGDIYIVMDCGCWIPPWCPW